jgi:hypothetical protein
LVVFDPLRSAIARRLVSVLEDRSARGEARGVMHEKHRIGGLRLDEQKRDSQGDAGGLPIRF